MKPLTANTFAHPRFQLVRAYAVVIFKRLVNPRVGREFFHEIIGFHPGMPFPPQYRAAHFGNSGKLRQQMFADTIEGKPRIDHIVDEQYAAIERAGRNGSELRNVQLTFYRKSVVSGKSVSVRVDMGVGGMSK